VVLAAAAAALLRIYKGNPAADAHFVVTHHQRLTEQYAVEAPQLTTARAEATFCNDDRPPSY